MSFGLKWVVSYWYHFKLCTSAATVCPRAFWQCAVHLLPQRGMSILYQFRNACVFLFRAIINHFNPKIESYAAVNHISQLSEEQVNTTHTAASTTTPPTSDLEIKMNSEQHLKATWVWTLPKRHSCDFKGKSYKYFTAQWETVSALQCLRRASLHFILKECLFIKKELGLCGRDEWLRHRLLWWDTYKRQCYLAHTAEFKAHQGWFIAQHKIHNKYFNTDGDSHLGCWKTQQLVNIPTKQRQYSPLTVESLNYSDCRRLQ